MYIQPLKYMNYLKNHSNLSYLYIYIYIYIYIRPCVALHATQLIFIYIYTYIHIYTPVCRITCNTTNAH